MINHNDTHKLEGLIGYLEAVPYDVTRKALYSAAELYQGCNAQEPFVYASCLDQQVYKHYISTGKQTDKVEESLARALHDNGIHNALAQFFKTHDSNRCIGIMGGHALLRTDDMYRQVVLLSKTLTENGFFMLSGGGPGAMEATHLGAWMAGRNISDVDDAISMMAVAPSFKDERWLPSAFSVLEKYPQHNYVSLGIPTWLYGHEPTTVFATHIAKFFENSIREDSILTLAYGGIIYAPGSAGTVQEIFQDAVQNHYLSFGFSSPMIFLGSKFWTHDMPVYPLLQQMMQTGMYKNLLLKLTDSNDEAIAELMAFSQRCQCRPV